MAIHFLTTPSYPVSDHLKMAVPAAVNLQWVLQVNGKLAAGRNEFVRGVIRTRNLPFMLHSIHSTATTHRGRGHKNAVRQLCGARTHGGRNPVRQGKHWQAFAGPAHLAKWIDMVGKADSEVSNVSRQERNPMAALVKQTRETSHPTANLTQLDNILKMGRDWQLSERLTLLCCNLR